MAGRPCRRGMSPPALQLPGQLLTKQLRKMLAGALAKSPGSFQCWSIEEESRRHLKAGTAKSRDSVPSRSQEEGTIALSCPACAWQGTQTWAPGGQQGTHHTHGNTHTISTGSWGGGSVQLDGTDRSNTHGTAQRESVRLRANTADMVLTMPRIPVPFFSASLVSGMRSASPWKTMRAP